MDPHEAISGGDWTLVRGGALLVEGARDIRIEGCNFTRLDSNALTLSGYTRDVQIVGNIFSLIGGNSERTSVQLCRLTRSQHLTPRWLRRHLPDG